MKTYAKHQQLIYGSRNLFCNAGRGLCTTILKESGSEATKKTAIMNNQTIACRVGRTATAS